MEQTEKQIGQESSTEATLEIEKKLNDILPILAHGLVKRLEKAGLAGKVKISSVSGEDWGVSKSPENPSNIPNVIVYPRSYLGNNIDLVNARLRHEIGNLNYPIEETLNQLRGWCEAEGIPSELLTSLAESLNEASVNHLEIQNSYSDKPEDNFRSLYNQEINASKIAEEICSKQSYRQAVDLSLLYSLARSGLIPEETFRQALNNCSEDVQESFDAETMGLLDKTLKISNSDKKAEIIRNHLWPKFSGLIKQPEQNQEEDSQDQDSADDKEDESESEQKQNSDGSQDEQQTDDSNPDVRNDDGDKSDKEDDAKNESSEGGDIQDKEGDDLDQSEAGSDGGQSEKEEGKIKDNGSQNTNDNEQESSGDDSQGNSTEGEQKKRDIQERFEKNNPGLLDQLRESEDSLGSQFVTKNESGEYVLKTCTVSPEDLAEKGDKEDNVEEKKMEVLDEIRKNQKAREKAGYSEASGLDGRALTLYAEYMEETRAFIDDLVSFFSDKFKLDKEFLYEKHQRRGARLEKGFTRNILGSREGKVIVGLSSLEKKKPPQKPQINWSLIIDNSGSCSGNTIEQEKRLAVALIEAAKILDIPLEIVTFGNDDDEEFVFLKKFDQDLFGDDLKKVVLLKADQGTPDVVTLEAACASVEDFMDQFRRSYNFVYFMTDGQSGAGSIMKVVEKYKKNMVITGIGLDSAAQSISNTWGDNALEVPEVEKLSDLFMRKIERQIEETFD